MEGRLENADVLFQHGADIQNLSQTKDMPSESRQRLKAYEKWRKNRLLAKMNYLVRKERKRKLTPEENNKEEIDEIKKYYPKQFIGLSKKITRTIL